MAIEHSDRQAAAKPISALSSAKGPPGLGVSPPGGRSSAGSMACWLTRSNSSETKANSAMTYLDCAVGECWCGWVLRVGAKFFDIVIRSPAIMKNEREKGGV